MTAPVIIDALQYANWSEQIFRQMRRADLAAVHATLAYHETFREAVDEIARWNARFAAHADLIAPARSADDVRAIHASGRTAVLFGFQNPSPIEGDIGLIEIFATLGLRFMQLAYNTQSLLAAGWQELEDGGVTRFGREAIAEMNRLGVAVDMSHAGARSALEAIELSDRPVSITHANPRWWRDTARNVPDPVIGALAETGGMLGFSLYPHHLAGGSDCRLEDFCAMVARTAERHGAGCLGIGSDLCQGRPDETVSWMRSGRWRKAPPDPSAVFPPQPSWFESNEDLPGVADGLRAAGFDAEETAAIMGGNWLRYFEAVFTTADSRRPSEGGDHER